MSLQVGQEKLQMGPQVEVDLQVSYQINVLSLQVGFAISNSTEYLQKYFLQVGSSYQTCP